MRKIVFLSLIILLISFSSRAQVDQEMWLSGGAKYSLTKKLDFSGELNMRMEPFVLNTFFTEISTKYEVWKWFKPSIDYRFVLDRNKYGNYKLSQRVNLNANFGVDWNRFEFGLRGRLQSTLSRVQSSESSFSDLAPGIRIRPEVLYDIKKSVFSPLVSAEFFYTKNEIDVLSLNKLRFSAGTELDLLGPFNVTLKYMYGVALHSPKYEHILSCSFSRKYKSAQAKKKKKKK